MTEKTITRPRIDYSKCTGCMDCVTFCPFSCLELIVSGKDRYGTLFPGLTGEGDAACTSCGICAKKCPIGVIRME